MKKIVSILMCLCLIMSTFTLISLPASAETYAGTCDDNLTWSLDTETGELIISGTGDMNDYSTSASAPWCSYGKYIKTITIGDDVTSIGRYAFYSCDAVTKVKIGKNVKTMRYNAFSSCRVLSEVYITDLKAWCEIKFENDYANPLRYTVSLVGTKLYLNDELVTELIIPDGVTSISDYAFHSCMSLTSVKIPESVTDIEKYAFYKCFKLKNITIPNSVKEIKDSAFGLCSDLTNVEIPDNTTKIGNDVFSDCSDLESIIIGNKVESIGNNAFYSCKSLKSVIIPDSVTSIGTAAFYGCESMKDITFGSGLTGFSDNLLMGCKKLESISVSDDNVSLCAVDGILFDKNKTKLIKIPAKHTKTSYEIPDSVTNVEKSAFRECKDLTSVSIPNSVINIGEYAFFECSSLADISIGDNVKIIGQEAFSYTAYSNKLDVWEDGALYIDKYFIGTYSSLSGDYIIKEGTKVIIDGAFDRCGNLTSVTIPDSVSRIGFNTFYSCNSLTSVTIPHTVTSIDYNAFVFCNSNLTIYGYDGTAAEFYANQRRFSFESLGEAPTHIHFYKFKVTKEPTCEESGIKTYTCICEDSYTEDISALGHSEVVDKAVEPTCTEIGLTEGSHCSTCGETFVVQEEVPVLGHTEVVDNAVEPTCTETGLTEGSHCSNCGETFVVQEEVPALGHTEVIDKAVAPTCTETGLTQGAHCSVCGEVLVAQQIVSVKGHVLKWTISKPATHFEAGEQVNKCSTCGEILSKKAIAKLAYTAPSITGGKKKITVKYKAVSGATGFEVRYKIKGSWKTLKYTTKKAKTVAIKKLKKGKYQVQVRAVKGNVKTNWSKVKKITVK